MPDNEPYQNSPHLVPRMAVPAASHPPAIGLHDRLAAHQVEEYVRDGDYGAVLRFVHELEYQLGVFKPSPWRVIEHLAGRAIGRQQEGSAETPAPAASDS